MKWHVEVAPRTEWVSWSFSPHCCPITTLQSTECRRFYPRRAGRGGPRLTASPKKGAKNLCLAGGVALNCVANGKVLRDGAFENVWIQPAAGDAGGAVGAALAAVHLFAGRPRKTNGGDAMAGALLGPSYSQSEIERRLAGMGAHFEIFDEDWMIETTA